MNDKFENHKYIAGYLNWLKDRVIEKDIHYSASWKKRGGVSAFMMLARKWDRIEEAMTQNESEVPPYDIFARAEEDFRTESISDDIDDLMGYLVLVKSELICRSINMVQYPETPPADPEKDEQVRSFLED